MSLRLAAADVAPLLAEFRKTKPEVSQVHVVQETPLIVAVTGQQGTRRTPADWARGELLGLFAHRGEQMVAISIVPNNDFPSAIWIDAQDAYSITFALADPDYGVRSDNLKIFFDPKTYFPRRMVRFAPVHVRRISQAAGVLTLTGSDGKQDFTARERNGTWRITSSPAMTAPPAAPVDSGGQVPPMPVSTLGEFERARPRKAELLGQAGEINEKVGPFQRVGTKIWVGKTFYDAEGEVGVGDVGYFDTVTQDWVFLHVPEMTDWAASALLVEPDAIWVGLVHNGEGAAVSGGLLRYDRTTRKATVIALSNVIERIIRVGHRIYCGTSGGFSVVEEQQAKNFEFSPQLDGSYAIVPAR